MSWDSIEVITKFDRIATELENAIMQELRKSLFLGTVQANLKKYLH